MSTKIRTWLTEGMDKDVDRALARVARIDDVAILAAMPDLHYAASVCVGVAIATRTMLFPDAVGGDIGCGMSALRFGNYAGELADVGNASAILRMLAKKVPIAKHESGSSSLPDSLMSKTLSSPHLQAKKAKVGRVQFATLGRGNHFVEFQRDSAGELWLMVHSGSRGIGQAIREEHGGAKGALEGLIARSDEGQAYLQDMQWALDYAKCSRKQMVEKIAEGMQELLGLPAQWKSYIDCHHNAVRQEQHGGEGFWVHRKGAISAREGELGIIPGSMGSASFHVAGRGHEASLCSASHGAGRCKSRTDAARTTSVRKLRKEMRGIWFDTRIANRLCDEAPSAYKDISAVMRAQRDLVKIVRRLEPLLVYKGG